MLPLLKTTPASFYPEYNREYRNYFVEVVCATLFPLAGQIPLSRKLLVQTLTLAVLISFC